MMRSSLKVRRFFKVFFVLCVIGLVVSVQAGSIAIEQAETSASVSGNGAVSGTAVATSSVYTIEREVSVSGEVQTGSQPASFSYRDSGNEWGYDGTTMVRVKDARVSVSGSIRGSGSATANASVYSAGWEDSLPDPQEIWLDTYILAETSTSTDTPGSRATASASASGTALGSGNLGDDYGIDTLISGKVTASSNSRSSSSPSSSYSIGMIGAGGNLSSDGTSGLDGYIMGLSGAEGENAGASASANGNVLAYASGTDFTITRISGKSTGASSVKNGGSEVTANGMIITAANPSGSDAMIYSNTTSSSSAPSFSGSGSASAAGSALVEINNHDGGYSMYIPASGSTNAAVSQSGAGAGTADALIIGCVDQPEEGFSWNADITPAGYIPDLGLFVQDLDAGLSLKSAVENAASIEGTSPKFRGSASSSVNGNARSSVSSKSEEYSVASSGKTQVKNSVSNPGSASGESRVEAFLFKDITSGMVGAYLTPDLANIPISGSIAGGSVLFDQFSASGTKASSSGSIKGSAQSSGLDTDLASSSISDGTLSGSVSTTNSAEANTAALLGSVHAAGLDSPEFSDSLFDASVMVSESNAADAIDTTGTAKGTLAGKTQASSSQSESMVQTYSSSSSVDGKAATSVTAQKGIGLAVSGLGSVSLVQPVLDPASPVASVAGAEGAVSYAIARGEDPAARVTSTSEVSGTASSGGSVDFCAAGFDKFSLTGNGQVTLSKTTAAAEARTKNESEAIAFGFTAQEAAKDGIMNVSRGVVGFGTGNAGSDNASVKANAKITRIDLSNTARFDPKESADIPSNISINFVQGTAISSLDSFANIANANVTLLTGVVDFNPSPPAGPAWGNLMKTAAVVTNANPNIANAYFEGIADSTGPQPALDLNLTPLLFGVYP
jgi:hypothetical protein